VSASQWGELFNENSIDQGALAKGDDVIAIGNGVVDLGDLAVEGKNRVAGAVDLKEVGVMLETGPGSSLEAGPGDELGFGCAEHLEHVSADGAEE
jgi:hypothetical protein